MTTRRGAFSTGKSTSEPRLKACERELIVTRVRRALLNRADAISPFHLAAIDQLLAASGNLLEGKAGKPALPRAFIGSSSEGLPVAECLQELVGDELTAVIWNQGTVFGLTDTTIESLEDAVLGYDYGIFVLTEDDQLLSREIERGVARDNVVFELGLFMGKLGRRHVFVVQKHGVSLTTDLSGLTTATLDLRKTNLKEALGPVSKQIKFALEHRA
jgi:predicted nucleotide-binding protein